MKKLFYILRIVLWVVLSGGTLVLCGFISNSMNNEKCREVFIEIEDARNLGFISEGEVLEILNSKFNTPLSHKIGELPTREMERTLNSHLFVEQAQVSISVDGKLNVSIRQRRPVLRVFADDKSFYIDRNGRVMPVSDKFTAHVPVVTGNVWLNYHKLREITDQIHIDSNELPSLYKDLLLLSGYLESDGFWKAQIEQIYVNKESEFELIPRVGNHTIVLGEVHDIANKLGKLMRFYRHGLSKTGWNEFKTINLKFKDQVVCTKRQSNG